MLTKEAHELQRFLVIKNEMRSERLNLLLLGSAVYQRRVVAIGNAEARTRRGREKFCLFGINAKMFSYSIGSDDEQNSL